MHGRQPLRIGTRGTKIALVQAQEAMAAIQSQFPDTPIELLQCTDEGTGGQPLSEQGAAGVFVTELERALLAGEIDLAIQSADELPTKLPDGLAIGGVLPRRDARDALVTRGSLETIAHLQPEARIGVTSARQRALALELRPDLQVALLSGDAEALLPRLDAGEVDGLILPVAGLERLGRADRLSCVFDDEHFLPAAGQGLTALEVRQGELGDICREVNDKAAMDELLSEREFLARCEAASQAPLGARAWVRERDIFTKAVIAQPEGRIVHRGGRTGPRLMAKLNGKMLAETLLAEGGKDYIVAWKRQAAGAPVS